MPTHFLKFGSLCAALVVVAGPAYAQTAPQPPKSMPPATPPAQSSAPAPAAPNAAHAMKADPASRRFVRKAIEGNFGEIELGRIAQQNSSDEGIRAYGKMLVDDHTKANEAAMAAARADGVNPPGGPGAEERRVNGRFGKLMGRAFDAQFVKHAIADHRKDIRDYQREAKRPTNDITRYAKASLPTLEKHLDQARALERDRNGRKSS